MKTSNLSSRAARGTGVIGVWAVAVAAGLAVAAAPASASQYATGWQCISPFVNYTNGTLVDPPAPQTIADSLAISVTRPGGEALSAKAGRELALRDLEVSFEYKDPRPLEALWTRTATLTTQWSGSVPFGATDTENRTLQLRAVPAGATVQGPATGAYPGGGTGPAPVAKQPGVAGERWWSFTVTLTPAQQAAPAVNQWYTDAAPAANGNVTRTYYTQKKAATGSDAPKTKADTFYTASSSSVGHKYVTHTGDNRFPVNASVVIEGTNTVEGTQTLHVEGSWIINVVDPTPGSNNDPIGYADGDHQVTAPVVRLRLPRSNWTPNGAGPVEFKLAQPGNAKGVVSRSTGYDRPGYNRPQRIAPYGNVWARFETESYGSSHDCIPGQISVADPSILANPNTAASFYGNVRPDATAANPDTSVGDLENPGFYKNGQGAWTAAVGSRGRFAFAPVAQAPLAVAPLEVAPVTPAPAPAPYVAKTAKLAASSVKASKSSKLSLKLENPNTKDAGFSVSIRTKSKYKIGKSAKTQLVGTAKRTVVGAGRSKTLSISLTKAAKTLLKTRKSLKVVVTIKPSDAKRAKATSKTITLKR